jgi:hypothetical protein
MNSTGITADCVIDFYRQACALLTRWGSILPQPKATEENAIAFCRALKDEGISVPDFPELRDEDTETEPEYDWACDECGEGGMDDDEHIALDGIGTVLCGDCVEDCDNCGGKVLPEDADNNLYTDECECEVCEECEERADCEDGVCEDCRDYDEAEVETWTAEIVGNWRSVVCEGEEKEEFFNELYHEDPTRRDWKDCLSQQILAWKADREMTDGEAIRVTTLLRKKFPRT